MAERKVLVRRDNVGWWCVGTYPGSGAMFGPGHFSAALKYAIRLAEVGGDIMKIDDPWRDDD